MPQEESDPRVELEPNFYYPQEDVLDEYAARTNTKWSVVMPSNILGAVPDAAMNLVFPLAVYATVQSHLKQPLRFPGGLKAWETPQDQSSAVLNGYLEEWAVLREQGPRGEKYNTADGSAFTWGGFWPTLAKWYGVEWEGPKLEGLKAGKTPYEPPPRG